MSHSAILDLLTANMTSLSSQTHNSHTSAATQKKSSSLYTRHTVGALRPRHSHLSHSPTPRVAQSHRTQLLKSIRQPKHHQHRRQHCSQRRHQQQHQHQNQLPLALSRVVSSVVLPSSPPLVLGFSTCSAATEEVLLMQTQP